MALLDLLSNARQRHPRREAPEPVKLQPSSVEAVLRGGPIRLDRNTGNAGESGRVEVVPTDGLEAGNEEQKAECPLCCSFFPASQLQRHVEAELEELEASERTDGMKGGAAPRQRSRREEAAGRAVTRCPMCGLDVPFAQRGEHMAAELAPLERAASEAAARVERARADLSAAGFCGAGGAVAGGSGETGGTGTAETTAQHDGRHDILTENMPSTGLKQRKRTNLSGQIKCCGEFWIY